MIGLFFLLTVRSVQFSSALYKKAEIYALGNCHINLTPSLKIFSNVTPRRVSVWICMTMLLSSISRITGELLEIGRHTLMQLYARFSSIVGITVQFSSAQFKKVQIYAFRNAHMRFNSVSQKFLQCYPRRVSVLVCMMTALSSKDISSKIVERFLCGSTLCDPCVYTFNWINNDLWKIWPENFWKICTCRKQTKFSIFPSTEPESHGQTTDAPLEPTLGVSVFH